MITRRDIARDAYENVEFRLQGSTDASTDAVRERVGKMLEGAQVRDLQRLSGPVLAGVLPRLYPRMLEVAYEHQDAGRPIFICTAAAQEMAELMAIVLTFDGAVGSVAEVIDGVYTGREGGPFNYREGKAQAIRELAEREDIDLAASYAYSDSRVRPADAAARRASCGRQSGQGAGARRARGGVGDHAVRASRAEAARRRGGRRGAAAAASPCGEWCAADEPP